MDDLNLSYSARLRQTLREQRRAVADSEREAASILAAKHAYDWLKDRLGNMSKRRVGVFLSLPEELNTQPLILRLWPAGTKVYLPVVHAKQAPLHWQPYDPDTLLTYDTLGIASPQDHQATRLSGMALDAVVVPLVGWDRYGYRIGMGGGFYDRTFAAKIAGKSPNLLGYAYACQEVPQGIAPQSWDVRLDGVVSELESLSFTGV
ncbi:5-formyltetrahydrofolate cyclo-ligase [Cardiobacteriaceae bacterium TAE3-ERU3]|nr:5-formyltetrahydrofolate cyclo-ligase [Cardiobacteriaceae bacterium TAE3-ERU3]